MLRAAEALRTLHVVDRRNLGINLDAANILIYNRELDAGGAGELECPARHVFHVYLRELRLAALLLLVPHGLLRGVGVTRPAKRRQPVPKPCD